MKYDDVVMVIYALNNAIEEAEDKRAERIKDYKEYGRISLLQSALYWDKQIVELKRAKSSFMVETKW